MRNEAVDRVVRAPVQATSLALVAFALAGCGGSRVVAPPPPPNEWAANAADVVGVLERDIALSAAAGDTLAAARRALNDASGLYTILVAYTDFGGCNHMVAAIGTPAPRYRRTERTLRAACVVLERAAALFTRATTTSDPRALQRATRLVATVAPLLAQAASAVRSS